MNSRTRTVAEITTELFLRLERGQFRYAVLRNYERLSVAAGTPADRPLTDIDLVVNLQDVPAFRNLAAALAEDCGWDVVTECGHFDESRVLEHRIEIFRFYRLSPPACLQVDIFHGYLLLGLPFESEVTMLEGRFYDPQLKLTRIARSTENAFRMLQIHSLLPDGAPSEKIARYRAKVVDHYAANETEFQLRLRSEFFVFGAQALDALLDNRWTRFRRALRLSKAWFLARFCLRHPLISARYFYERSRDHWLRFMRRQCGFVMAAYAPSDRDRALLRSALDDLKHQKILPAWTSRASGGARTTWNERKVMERGGIVVDWAKESEGALDVTRAADSDELVARILPLLIARHPALYERSASKPILLKIRS